MDIFLSILLSFYVAFVPAILMPSIIHLNYSGLILLKYNIISSFNFDESASLITEKIKLLSVCSMMYINKTISWTSYSSILLKFLFLTFKFK